MKEERKRTDGKRSDDEDKSCKQKRSEGFDPCVCVFTTAGLP